LATKAILFVVKARNERSCSYHHQKGIVLMEMKLKLLMSAEFMLQMRCLLYHLECPVIVLACCLNRRYAQQCRPVIIYIATLSLLNVIADCW